MKRMMMKARDVALITSWRGHSEELNLTGGQTGLLKPLTLRTLTFPFLQPHGVLKVVSTGFVKVPIYFALLAVFLLINPSDNIAQLGIKAGVGVSDIGFLKEGQTPYLGYEINDLEHRKPLVTFQAGAFGTFGIWKKFHFQPELLFISQGLDYSTNFLFDDITYKVKINYLQIPLLLKYQSAPEKKRHMGLFLGPYTSFKLKATRITKMEGKKEKNKMSNVKDFDFGIIAGLSFDLDLADRQMVFDFRTSYSLVNMMERVDGFIPWYYGPSKEYARNISIILTVGYQFFNL